MKKALIIALSSFLLFGCDRTNNDDPVRVDFDPYIVENYLRDAKQLYFHEIIQDSTHANFNNPILDQNEINKILEIIQAVYNSTTPERDTVFDVYRTHGYYCYDFSSIYLKVHPEFAEIQNLANGIFPTGDPALDHILSTYEFDSVSRFSSYPNFAWLSIYTQNEYNLIPAEREFAGLASIQVAEFNKGCIGDGDNITLARYADFDIIIFSIGRGDCPAGCIYHRYWEFKVANGTAEFIRSYE